MKTGDLVRPAGMATAVYLLSDPFEIRRGQGRPAGRLQRGIPGLVVGIIPPMSPMGTTLVKVMANGVVGWTIDHALELVE